MKKPTPDEVRSYWILIGLNGTDIEFYDHFQANGWMTGKVPMKDWQAAARNWSRNEIKYGRQTVNERPSIKSPDDGNQMAEIQRLAAVEIAEIERARAARKS